MQEALVTTFESLAGLSLAFLPLFSGLTCNLIPNDSSSYELHVAIGAGLHFGVISQNPRNFPVLF
jgi:hypothetical protein